MRYVAPAIMRLDSAGATTAVGSCWQPTAPDHEPGERRTTNPKNANVAANNKPNAPAKIAVSDANHHTLFVRHVHTPKPIDAMAGM